jgi:FkbH-like protein
LARLGWRFVRDGSYRTKVMHLLNTQTAGAAPIKVEQLRRSLGWMDGKRVYLVGGCELTFIKEHLEALGAVTYHTFDHQRPSDPLVEMLDPGSAFTTFDADVVVLSQVQVATGLFHGLQWRGSSCSRDEQEADLAAMSGSLSRAVDAVREVSSAPVFLLTHPIAYRPALGVLEHRVLGDTHSLAETIKEYELALYQIARTHEGCFVLDVSILLADIPVRDALQRDTELLGEHFTIAGSAPVAEGLVLALHALDARSRKIKCVVVDLDDTLWSGVLREDGPAGVIVRHQVLRALKYLVRRGVVLAVVSKNDPVEVEHLEPLLGQHIMDATVAIELGWGPKSEAIKRIAEQLNIGLDAFAFFDDSPRERAEVEMNAPEVLVLPDSALLAALSMGEFQAGPTLTEEAANRASSYKAQSQRVAAADASSPEQFLASLDLRLDLHRAKPEELARVAELIGRTNQLNATLARTGLPELQRYLTAPAELDVRVAYLSDRFGDYGLIGVAVIERDGNDFRLRELAFSCRAMGRNVETAMLTYLGRALRGAGDGTALVVDFLPTERNGELRKILEGAGFTGHEQGTGVIAFAAPLASVGSPAPSWLAINTDLVADVSHA